MILILILTIGGVSCLVLGILALLKEKRTVAKTVIAIIAIIVEALITMLYINLNIISIISIYTKYIMK